MTAGIQVFDKYGNEVINTSTLLGKIVGYVWTGTSAGSAALGGFSGADNISYFMVRRGKSSRSSFGVNVPIITISKTQISWTFDKSQAGNENVPADVYIVKY